MSKARASKRGGKNSLISRIPLPLWFGLGGALLVFGAFYFGFRNGQPPSSESQPEVTGAPGLIVDQQLIDFGDVPVGQTVSAEFRISNVGDKPLRFEKTPYIEVKEGC